MAKEKRTSMEDRIAFVEKHGDHQYKCSKCDYVGKVLDPENGYRITKTKYRFKACVKCLNKATRGKNKTNLADIRNAIDTVKQCDFCGTITNTKTKRCKFCDETEFAPLNIK